MLLCDFTSSQHNNLFRLNEVENCWIVSIFWDCWLFYHAEVEMCVDFCFFHFFSLFVQCMFKPANGRFGPVVKRHYNTGYVCSGSHPTCRSLISRVSLTGLESDFVYWEMALEVVLNLYPELLNDFSSIQSA